MVRRWSASLLVLSAACGGSDGGTTTPDIKDFSVSLSAPSLAVTAGTSGNITATISRTGDFKGTVDLSVESLPTGVTATFSPSSITTATTQTTLSVAVAPTVAAGSYSFTIRGKATGLSDHTATVTLTVNAAPSIALTISSTLAIIPVGGGTSFSATVTRTNYTGPVTVAVSGAPNGVTSTLTTTGDVTTIALAASASTTPGSYSLSISASGSGVASVWQLFSLTVNPLPATLTMSLSPPALSIQQGSNGQSTITITRANFTGAVDLTLGTLPNGITGAFGQSSVTANSTTLTISVSGTVAPGTYSIAVNGVAAAANANSVTATLAVTVTAAPTGSISLALTSALPTIQQGQSAGVTLVVTRSGFTGAVTLTAAGAPPGVTTTFTPSPTTIDQWLVSFSVRASAPAGTYGITITGAGSGIPNASVTGTLTITATPAIAMTLSPQNDSVVAGGGRSFTANIARTNYTAPVTVSVSGAPNGVTTTVTGSPTSASTVTVNISASLTTALGTYTLTVTANGAGVQSVNATYTLKVQQPPITGGNVSWSFVGCNAIDRPIWLAVQNGNGPWQQVTNVGDVYGFNISGAGGIAYVTQNGANDYLVSFVYGTLNELQGRGTGPCTVPTGKSVTGSVANVGAAPGNARVTLGSTAAQITSPATTFTLSNVANGALDLVAARQALGSGSPIGFATDKLIVRRALSPANGATLPVLDFAAAEAFDPDIKPLTLNGAVAGETVTASNVLLSANAGFGFLSFSILSGSTANYAALPTARMVSGDLHVLQGTATQSSGGSTTTRSSTQVFHDATSKVVNLGSALATPTFTTLASTPYLRTRVQLAAQADYNRYFFLNYSQSVTGAKRSVWVTNTSSYLSGAPFAFDFPDFSGVSGWQNVWGPLASTSLGYLMSASGWTLGPAGYTTPYIEGTNILQASRSGSVVP